MLDFPIGKCEKIWGIWEGLCILHGPHRRNSETRLGQEGHLSLCAEKLQKLLPEVEL